MSTEESADVLTSLGWHRDFSLLLRELEKETFWRSTSRVLSRHLCFNTWVALVFHRDHPPTILADSDEDDGADEMLFQDYQKGLYLLDPFYVAARATPVCTLVTLDDVAPEQFTQTEYYQRYFRRNIVADEVQLNQPLENGSLLCLSLGSVETFNTAALGLLQLIQPWLCELMRLRIAHETSRSHPPRVHPWHPMGDQQLPGTSRHGLTEREREVSQLMLGGCSTKEIARRLGISIETVRAHKKHLYSKLGINTQAELFSRFWQEQP
ncbi:MULTISPECIES: helix-turn-helix transcriptional regulator [Cobetia]|uniref:Helix-turn-helix transcriptional regulator n=1 Tax=Cobetia crustatorum TaxID=553385 RepID=A0A558HLT4_9GAMM|nr:MULTISPECIES: helix-turn-helix transcriptional regulator [Cobetia]TVU70075.1 helix-turn-helix transcriptional regulator [Cobetia crustatorum]